MASALKKLRNQVIQGRKEGCICPVCNQYAKEYNRHVTCTMVQTLFVIKNWFDKNDPTLEKKWLHVSDHVADLPKNKRPNNGNGGGDWTKMRFWKLIEPMPGIRTDGSPRVGYWRITEKGVKFLAGQIKIPKIAVVYNNTLVKFSDESVDVHECLKKNFDYNDLMKMAI